MFLNQLICYFNITEIPLLSEKCCEEENELQDVKSCLENKKEESASFDLPETVSRLTNEYGSEVYLVGTAHFSLESQEDVSRV